MDYRHWHLTKDAQDILWLSFDKAGESANTFDEETLSELNTILDHIPAENAAGLIITSAKPSGYIAGANLERAYTVKDEKMAYDFIRGGQRVFDKLEQLTIPTVAMISGYCLGGGLEMSLACDYRVAEIRQETKIGLPEILIGIHPGWGGTVRLPRLMSVLKSMDLILTGRTLSAEKARKINLVDAAVPKRLLENTARYYVLAKPPKVRVKKSLLHAPVIKSLLGWVLKRQLKKKVSKALYPAPYAVVDLWLNNQGLEAEARSVSQLLVGPTSKNLLRVFFLRELLKNMGKKSGFQIEHVHVIGAGTMGGDIAAWCAYSGFKVTLEDTDLKNIGASKKRAASLFQKITAKDQFTQTLDRLIVDPQGEHRGQADVVIEAIFEDLEVKRALLKSVEKEMKPGAILATNTSSIPIEELCSVLAEPTRLVGIHFFNPVSKMQLVEVIAPVVHSEEILQKAHGFVHQINRLSLPVKNSPGFLVNRILLPYLMEAMILCDEGVGIATIDAAATSFGMPMGPMELADTIGLDVCFSVAKNFQKHFALPVPKCLVQKTETKTLGRKTGSGFYRYKRGRKVSEGVSNKNLLTIQQRLIYRLLNEAVECLHQKIVAHADFLDAGMIFGTGFAPCHGGPIHYINSLGREHCLEQLNMIKHYYGPEFKVSEGWDNAALFLTKC